MVNIQIEISLEFSYNLHMKKIEAFVFDMDGIILDTESICEKTWIKAGKEFGIQDEKAMELFKKCIGTNKNDTFNILKTSLGADFSVQNFMEQTSIFFSEIEKSEGIALMPFAKQTLEYLKGKGYRLALASSTRGPVVTRQLKNASLLSFFESLSTGDKVSHSKPDPEIYKLACKSLNLPPEKCAAVEDSPNGIKSAKSAGLFTIMVPDRIEPDEELLKKVDFVCSSLNEVKLKF